jgi:hypothetical protein
MEFVVNKKSVFTFYLLLFTIFSFSQDFRNSGFSKPMNLPFNLAGSFGEPRPDHFHSGIDIKTNGVEGEPVFAIGDGYISRIRVSPYGYGKAIYITHTNGYTSVYGHLSKFYGAIEKYIHAQHYAQQKSELDLYLDAKQFPLKQNDTIAFSGNTGGSTAPHLHFEIRNTKTEHALNPLDFYPREYYLDTIPPQINKVKVQFFNYDSTFSSGKIFNLKYDNGIYKTDKIIDIVNYHDFVLSLEGYDKQDNSANKNGIKKIEVFQKDSLVFKYDLTEINFDITRMCNAFIDYDEMMNDSGYFYNCYRLTNNTLDFYTPNINKVFRIIDSLNLIIICYDYNNNISKINLNFMRHWIQVIQRNESQFLPIINTKKPNTVYVSPIKKEKIILKNFKVLFQEETFYNYLPLLYYKNLGDTELYTIDGFSTLIPLQKPAKIEFKSSIKKNRNKIVVVRQNQKGNETALKTTFAKNKFYADTKELGSFYLKYDTTKPTVTIVDPNFAVRNTIYALLKDNLSGINTYNGYIDNKWVNFYYDAKNDLIQYNVDENCTKGEHLLKIIVTDNVGNQTTVQQKFIY